MATNIREAAVRAYLQALTDPDTLRDDEGIAELQERLEGSDDPLERVKLQAEIEQAKQVRPDAFEDGFIAHAKEWADEHGVSATAFQAEGVPRTVLRRAGLDGGRSARRGAQPARKPKVSRGDVRAVVQSHPSFTLPQIQTETGASRETVRTVIKEALDAGTIEKVGPDDAQQAGGGRRSTTAYRRPEAQAEVGTRRNPPPWAAIPY